MAFPQWPKNKVEKKENEGFPEELFDLVGSEDRHAIVSAVERLKSLVADLPRTGRSLAKSDREFVIPLETSEQKEAILDALYDLSIFPWEENGELIIEHKRDLAKLRAAGFEDKGLPIISIPAQGTGLSGPSAPNPSFPMQYPQTLAEDLKDKFASGKAAVADERRTRVPHIDESEIEPGADTELNDLINRFDSGQIEEDDSEFRKRVGYLPSLRLFPHQYVWEKGKLSDKRSGVEISKDQQQGLYEAAKEGDVDAMTALVRIHTGLVLKVVSKYTEKFGGDPDDLFQEGMIGLIRAIQLKDEREGSFSTYAMIHIESRIRRLGYENKYDIRRPSHVAQQASELRRAKEAVSSEGELRPEDVFAELPNHKASTGVGLDRLERLYYLNAAFDPVSFDEENPIDKDAGLRETGTDSAAEEYVGQKELEQEFGKVLLKLPPREERILRMRFGLGVLERDKPNGVRPHPGNTDTWMTLEEIGQEFGVTRDRIRQIEARALRNLKHPSRSRALRQFQD